MRINLNQLSVFYLAARHKSMLAAARLLFVSPPAVTMQIKNMEGWLGFPVFERGQGELRLTERGQGLYDALGPIFSHLDELEQYIQDLLHTEEAELRLGAHHLPGNYFISDLIAHVHRTYPGLKVQLELGTQDVLLEKLYQQKLDMVLIIGDLPPHSKCNVVHLFDEDMALVTAADGELGKIESLTAKELATLPLIVQQKGTGALRAVRKFLSDHEIEPHIVLDNISSDVIKQFLPTRHAAAFIGRFIVQKELDEGILHEIKIVEGPPVSHFYLVSMETQHIPTKIKQFMAGQVGFLPKFHMPTTTRPLP